MPKLTSFSIHGLELYFNSSDHIPPHFHVLKKGEWEIRVFFFLCGNELKYETKWPRSKKLPGRIKNQILKLVKSHIVELLTEWEDKVLVKEDDSE